MQNVMDGVLQRYGQKVLLEHGGKSRELRVLFHSVNSRSWQNMEREFFPLGEIPRGQYICVFPAEAEVAADDTLTVAEKTYRVRRVERMFLSDRCIYRWGLCVEKGGNGT